MRRVPRHEFMTGSTLDVAYRDEACPIGHGQTISQPTIVALMTNALRLSGRERVLEIGTGCGYQTAVLASLAAEIYSLELLEPLATRARLRLAEMGVKNVYLRVGDGYGGWPEHAPFDRIVVTAAPPELPAELAAQLAENGVLVMPVGEGEQSLMRFVKKDQVLVREELGAVRFVPMVRSR
ncbi:MAG: protein-L-isoaspartate(D-aspartate) O-methyltransferase [Myxococcales bacterium]|nr:protein-L-isoaspartate(D-aspartate) O-methyltransferase [Myxococcales bacterium]